MIVQLEAQVEEEQEKTVLLVIKTGFGDPVVRVARDHFMTVNQQRDNLEKVFGALIKDGQGLNLHQEQVILQALGWEIKP